MRLLLVHPGASMSTHDVFIGVREGLKACGHEVAEYSLDARIEASGAWLTYCWRKGGKTVTQPTSSDIIYHAGAELVTRTLRLMPDVVVVVSAMYLHPDVLVLMRRAGIKVAVMLTESPYDDEQQRKLLPWVNVAWTNERSSARMMGIGYLPHAWTPSVHDATIPIATDIPSHDVVFVGTGFEERIDLLSAVDWTGIDLALYGSWDMLGSRHKLRQYIRGSYVLNSTAAQLYRRARIGLNLYRRSQGFGKGAPKISHAESLNPRAYELAALGCFSLSDARDEIGEVFGSLVPTFDGPAELRALVTRWLADPAGRSRVQAALPHAVAAHTWHARAAQIERDLLGAGIVASRADEALAAASAGGS